MNELSKPTTPWEHYQDTMTPAPGSCFDQARTGDLIGLRETWGTLRDRNEKDAKGYTVLMLAAYHGHAPMTDYLIAQGADVNTCDAAGNSVLMGAAFKGHADIIRSLLRAGAEKDYRNPKGQTALQFAHMFARHEVVQLLAPEQSSTKLRFWRRSFGAWTQFLFSSLKKCKADPTNQGA